MCLCVSMAQPCSTCHRAEQQLMYPDTRLPLLVRSMGRYHFDGAESVYIHYCDKVYDDAWRLGTCAMP